MTGIDPTTCGPDDAYVVRLPHRGRTHIAQRINPDGDYPWRAIVEADAIAASWYADSAVTVLHRLVPEAEEKTLDVPMQPWDVLLAARMIVITAGHDPAKKLRDVLDVGEYLSRESDRLEAEHHAAQEKAAAAREASIAPARAKDVADWLIAEQKHKSYWDGYCRHRDEQDGSTSW